jgi:hypothetical protein
LPRSASANSSLLAGGIQTGLGSLFEHGPFELCESTHHLHHHSTCRGGRVDRFGQAAESGSGFAKAFHNREHITKGARQPVQLPHHEHVCLAESIEKPMKFSRSQRPPDAFSRKMRPHPDYFSAETCAAVSWSSVETRA